MVEFVFLVKQRNCGTPDGEIQGGSAFEAFSHSLHYLASCAYHDLYNRYYLIVCRTPSFGKTSVGHEHYSRSQKASETPLRVLTAEPEPEPEEMCMRVTIMLMYEHFDAVGETLYEMFTTPLYLPLLTTLLDNTLFCALLPTAQRKGRGMFRIPTGLPVYVVRSIEANLEFQTDHESLVAESNYVIANPHIRWFSGLWTTEENMHVVHQRVLEGYRRQQHHDVTVSTDETTRVDKSDLGYDAVAEYFITVQRFHQIRRDAQKYGTIMYYGCDAPFPSISTDNQESDWLSKRYEFYPTLHTAGGDMLPLTSIWKKDISKLLNSAEGRQMEYYWWGASHLRYDFDLLIKILHGEDALRGVERKHDALSFGNMHWVGAAYAMQVAVSLEAKCAALRTAAANGKSLGNATFVIQTGAWDLGATGVRRYISDPITGLPRLLATVERLASGELDCPGLMHIVFATAVPYPFCFDHEDWHCDLLRGYRNNDAIAASNDFAISTLLAMNFTATRRLSIVDSFGIIKPRIILNSDNEVICSNHYVCREDQKGLGQINDVITKGGYANLLQMVQAMLL